MKRVAKNPTQLNKWGIVSMGVIRANQIFLDDLIKSLNNPKYINDAIQWDTTPEGYGFWQDYYNQRVDTSKQTTRLKQMIEELAIPFKPFKKEDWI